LQPFQLQRALFPLRFTAAVALIADNP